MNRNGIMQRGAVFIAAAAVLTIAQMSVITFLPFPFSALNLVLTAALFVFFITRSFPVLWLVLMTAFFLELFSAESFGFLILSLFVSVSVSERLFIYFFTNRSLPALLVLGFCGTLIYHFVFFLLKLAGGLEETTFLFAVIEYGRWFIWSVVFNLVLLILFFATVNRFSRRLKSVFLFKQ